MTKEMLTKELKKVTEEIIYEEMADLHYNFAKLTNSKQKRLNLKKNLLNSSKFFLVTTCESLNFHKRCPEDPVS